MAFAPTAGTRSSPTQHSTIASASAIAANTVPEGWLVTDPATGVVYLMRANFAASTNNVLPFSIGNRLQTAVSTNAAPLAIATADNAALVVATGTAHTISLPLVAENKGRIIRISAPTAGVSNVTIDPAAAELINGASTYVMNENFQFIDIFCDGVSWFCFDPFSSANRLKVGVSTNAAPLVMTPADNIGLVIATGTAHTVTLPNATGSAGRVVQVVNNTNAAAIITVAAFATQTVNQTATLAMLAVRNVMMTCWCDGTEWFANIGDPTP